MDILYHAASGIAIAHIMHAPSPYSAAFAATLPDVAGIIPYFAIKLIQASKNPEGGILTAFIRKIRTNTFANAVDATCYRATHSLYTAAAVAGLAYLFFRDQWLLLSVSYLSHILIDIPAHDGDFATRVLFPTSTIRIQGANWATHPKIFLSYWAALGSIMFFLWRT